MSPVRPRDADDADSPPRGKRSRHELRGEALEDVDEERMEREEEQLFGKDSDDEADKQAVDEKAVSPAQATNDEPLDDQFLCEPCGSSDPFVIGPDHGRVPKTLTSPIRPSAADVEKHYATHLPFRSWCPVCQAAKMREDPHWRSRRELQRDGHKSGLPIISLDYQEFDKDDATKPAKSEAKVDEEPDVKTIVAKDEVTGSVLSYRVLRKGPTDEWVVKRLVKDFKEWGRTDFILKTDGHSPPFRTPSRSRARASGRSPVTLQPTIRRLTGRARKPCRTSTGTSGP